MTDTVLQMKDVSSAYGNLVILENINIEVEKGKIVCILGSNGAGKTTLIKTILGLVKLKQGTILFKNGDISNKPTHSIVRKGISVVPQGKRIFPKMSVVENLRMGAFAESNENLIKERIDEVFEIFSRLAERKSQIAGTMSGGEQSMLSIGRGLMSKPDLMLIDEPSLGLAPILVEKNFQIIKTINETGTTVLLVEQNAHMTLEIADYGYVLQKGQVIDNGTAKELMENELIKSAYLSG